MRCSSRNVTMLVEDGIVSERYPAGKKFGLWYESPKGVAMSKFTAEELEKELKRRKAAREATPDKQQCVNCGRSFSSLTAEASEHGLCDDCLLGADE